MNTLSYKTISVNKETAKKEWVVIDATDQVVGRLCSKVAKLIRGKYKPTFTPHVDCGDNVIIINAAKAVFTGKKETDKVYTRYTGYPGGQRFNTPAELRKRPDGLLRDGQHPGDLLLGIALVVIQQYRHAIALIQRHHRVEQLPALRGLEGQGAFVVHDVLHPVPRRTEDVLAPVDGHPDEPALEMLVALKRGVGLIELYQYVLGHVVGVRFAAQVAVSHPEYGIHIPFRRQGKLLICHGNDLLEKLFTGITQCDGKTFQKIKHSTAADS